MNYKMLYEQAFTHRFPPSMETEDRNLKEWGGYMDQCFKMSLLEEFKHLNETLSYMKRKLCK